jgi:hypothetical protein
MHLIPLISNWPTKYESERRVVGHVWYRPFLYTVFEGMSDPMVTTGAHTRVYPKVSGLGHNEISNNKNEHSLREATQKVMVAELIRLTHQIAIQLHLVAESYTICSSRSRRPVRKLFDTPS